VTSGSLSYSDCFANLDILVVGLNKEVTFFSSSDLVSSLFLLSYSSIEYSMYSLFYFVLSVDANCGIDKIVKASLAMSDHNSVQVVHV